MYKCKVLDFGEIVMYVKEQYMQTKELVFMIIYACCHQSGFAIEDVPTNIGKGCKISSQTATRL